MLGKKVKDGFKQGLRSLVCRSLKAFEEVGARYRGFGSLYYNLFYRGIVESELEAAGLEPGSRVLHVGCGPLPMTSVALAREGHTVTAIDKDNEAVLTARRFIDDFDLDINVMHGDGSIDMDSFDAVWVSLHVSPKTKFVEKASKLDIDRLIVFRDVRGWLKALYPSMDISSDLVGRDVFSVERDFGKKSVFVYGGDL